MGVEHLSRADGKICQCTGGKSGQKDVEEFIPGLKGGKYRIGISLGGKRVRKQLKQADGGIRCMHSAA